MHLEICVEDSSGKIFLENILSRVIRDDVTWRIHSYRGIGRIPTGLKSTDNAEHRVILDNLPKLIRGCDKTPYVSALLVIVDSDRRDCKEFLTELKQVHNAVAPNASVIFRLAIEEMEAWMLGDQDAISAAYQNVQSGPMRSYVQDSVCGTWEVLADAIFPGGADAIRKMGWPAPGKAKCEWASNIPPHMDLSSNKSPSFNKLLQALEPFAIAPE